MKQKDLLELYEEMTENLLHNEKPSFYLSNLSRQEENQIYPLSVLWRMKTTEQSKEHHPEGSVWNHTLLVLDEAAKVRDQSSEPKVFMWAALLHDIGKPGTTRERKGKITSYDHDYEGEKLCIEFLNAFFEKEEFIKSVSSLVRYHMHMLYVLKGLPYGDMKGLLRNVDCHQIALLCKCDRMGRIGADRAVVEAEYGAFLQKLLSLKVQIGNKK